MGSNSVRKYMKGLVFQNSNLEPYKKYVQSKEMTKFITQSFNAEKPVDGLPYNLGATRKDFE